jgi:hypothetical protein
MPLKKQSHPDTSIVRGTPFASCDLGHLNPYGTGKSPPLLKSPPLPPRPETPPPPVGPPSEVSPLPPAPRPPPPEVAPLPPALPPPPLARLPEPPEDVCSMKPPLPPASVPRPPPPPLLLPLLLVVDSLVASPAFAFGMIWRNGSFGLKAAKDSVSRFSTLGAGVSEPPFSESSGVKGVWFEACCPTSSSGPPTRAPATSQAKTRSTRIAKTVGTTLLSRSSPSLIRFPNAPTRRAENPRSGSRSCIRRTTSSCRPWFCRRYLHG